MPATRRYEVYGTTVGHVAAQRGRVQSWQLPHRQALNSRYQQRS
jgi:hypothetical protein